MLRIVFFFRFFPLFFWNAAVAIGETFIEMSGGSRRGQNDPFLAWSLRV